MNQQIILLVKADTESNLKKLKLPHRFSNLFYFAHSFQELLTYILNDRKNVSSVIIQEGAVQKRLDVMLQIIEELDLSQPVYVITKEPNIAYGKNISDIIPDDQFSIRRVMTKISELIALESFNSNKTNLITEDTGDWMYKKLLKK